VDVLNFMAGLAEIVLAIELVFVVFVLAAICAGIWFGLSKAESKGIEPGFAKLNEYLSRGAELRHKGIRTAMTPLIALVSFGEVVSVTVRSLVARAKSQG